MRLNQRVKVERFTGNQKMHIVCKNYIRKYKLFLKIGKQRNIFYLEAPIVDDFGKYLRYFRPVQHAIQKSSISQSIQTY